MAEHMLREAQDPGEVFMTKNFIHYLRCLCADEFDLGPAPGGPVLPT